MNQPLKPHTTLNTVFTLPALAYPAPLLWWIGSTPIEYRSHSSRELPTSLEGSKASPPCRCTVAPRSGPILPFIRISPSLLPCFSRHVHIRCNRRPPPPNPHHGIIVQPLKYLRQQLLCLRYLSRRLRSLLHRGHVDVVVAIRVPSFFLETDLVD